MGRKARQVAEPRRARGAVALRAPVLLGVLLLAAPPTAAAASSSSSALRRRASAIVDGQTITGYVGEPLSVEEASGQLPPPEDSSSSVLPSAMDPLYSSILNDHNGYRSKHRAPALIWDDGAASRAQVTVDSCRFEHQAQGDGENIAYTSDLNQAAALAWAVKVRARRKKERGGARRGRLRRRQQHPPQRPIRNPPTN
jgi:hypothetical protein